MVAYSVRGDEEAWILLTSGCRALEVCADEEGVSDDGSPALADRLASQEGLDREPN